MATNNKKILIKPLFISLIATVFFLFPLVKNPQHAIPDKGDTFHNVWIMGLNSKKILNKNPNLNEGNIYYPNYKNTLVFSEKLYIQSLLFLPFYILREPILGYNIQLFLSFILTYLLSFLIFYKISKNQNLSMLGSFVATFFPFKFLHLPHLQLLSTQWLLLPLVFLIYKNGKLKSLKDSLILSILSLPQLISWGHLTIFLYIFLFSIMFFSTIYASRKEKLVLAKNNFFSLLIIIATCAYFYLPYINSYRQGNFRTDNEAILYEIDLLQWLAPASNSKLYSNHLAKFSEITESICISGLFSGITLAILLLLSFFKIKYHNKKLKITHTVNFNKKWKNYFLVILTILFTLSLGNTVKINKINLLNNPIYKLSRFLLFGKSIRYLPVYAIPIFFCFGAIISLAKIKIIQKFWWLILMLLTIEFYPNLTISQYHFNKQLLPVYQWLNQQNDQSGIVEIPINKTISGDDPYWYQQFEYMLHSIYHNKKMINGISGFFPQEFRKSVTNLKNFPDQTSIDHLNNLKVKTIIVHYDYLNKTDKNKIDDWSIKPILTFPDQTRIYQLNK